MSKRVLYVGGLSDATSDYQLRDLFGTYGVVARAYIVRHKHSGKSAGYGFVEMGSGEQALSAVVALEGVLFEGNSLRLYVTPYVSANS
ncbi:MAG: RNA-binding protein [Nitrospirae bacterium]|nr:RNA-binding protein [Nitrospirota bacterium]